ncbi:hypothetical protein [Pseudomonas huanghezhanensis]|uniref:hypothetical protein n=1 Tax=Pseudomonas huanghezhanensis TaxID=3002903 RepID=UPI002285E334|nr:hypothetical protein [Pseudomonas sp. BSw22131]
MASEMMRNGNFSNKTLTDWAKKPADFTEKYEKYEVGYSLLLMPSQQISQTLGAVGTGELRFKFDVKSYSPDVIVVLVLILMAADGGISASPMPVFASPEWTKYDVGIYPEQDYASAILTVTCGIGSGIKTDRPADKEVEEGPVRVGNFSLT